MIKVVSTVAEPAAAAQVNIKLGTCEELCELAASSDLIQTSQHTEKLEHSRNTLQYSPDSKMGKNSAS